LGAGEARFVLVVVCALCRVCGGSVSFEACEGCRACGVWSCHSRGWGRRGRHGKGEERHHRQSDLQQSHRRRLA
jgi:hypothetical protein